MTSRGRPSVHIASVTNLHRLLEDAIGKPESFSSNADLVAALQSQGALAEYENAEKGIVPSSINTLKRISSKKIDGGFPAFDASRIAAKVAIADYLARAQKSNKTTKEGLRAKVEELERQLLVAHRGSWQLTKALNESIQNSRSYAESSGKPSIVERCRKDQQKLLKVFALFAQPGTERNHAN